MGIITIILTFFNLFFFFVGVMVTGGIAIQLIGQTLKRFKAAAPPQEKDTNPIDENKNIEATQLS